MKWLFIAGVVAAALVALVALMALVGSRLPQAHVATREIQLAVPPEVVWQTITDVEAFPTWRTDVSRVERLPDRAGRKTWAEHGRDGRLTLTVDRAEPPRVLVSRIADPNLPFGGAWTYNITPMAGGSTVKITENGEIYNPMFRFMARFVFGYERTMAAYLAALQKKFAAAAGR